MANDIKFLNMKIGLLSENSSCTLYNIEHIDIQETASCVSCPLANCSSLQSPSACEYVQRFRALLESFYDIDTNHAAYKSSVITLYHKLRATIAQANCSECREEIAMQLEESTLIPKLRQFARLGEELHEIAITTLMYG